MDEFIVDPSGDENGEQQGARPKLSAGERTLWAAGLKYVTSSKGTRGIEVMFVCVDGPEARAYVWDTFYLTQAASWKLRAISRALRRDTPWSATDHSEASDVLLHCPVTATVEMEERDNGTERPRCVQFAPFGGDITKDMEAVVTDAETHWRKMNGSEQPAGGVTVSDEDIPF